MPATVLVVEDEPDLAHVMALALRRSGYDVVAVDSGGAARAVVADREVDVVVMDRGLPGGMDGLEATALLRADGYPGTVLVTSGYSGAAHTAACLDAGADGVLGKPFALADLVDRVGSSVQHPTGQVTVA